MFGEFYFRVLWGGFESLKLSEMTFLIFVNINTSQFSDSLFEVYLLHFKKKYMKNYLRSIFVAAFDDVILTHFQFWHQCIFPFSFCSKPAYNTYLIFWKIYLYGYIGYFLVFQMFKNDILNFIFILQHQFLFVASPYDFFNSKTNLIFGPNYDFKL